jgi:hypothetical protein
MKKLQKIILSVAITLFSTTLTAQETQYKRCLDGVARWALFELSLMDTEISTTDIYAYGDTTINGIVYKKMYYNYSFGYQYLNGSDEYWQNIPLQDVNYDIYGWEGYFIRESEDASQLFIYVSYFDEEFLISDMNLEVGDTILYYLIDKIVVDSVFYQDEVKYIVVPYQFPFLLFWSKTKFKFFRKKSLKIN